MKKILIKNAHIASEVELVDLEIVDGIIKKIKPAQVAEKDDAVDFQVIDVHGQLIAPAFVDVHVHARTPGFEYKEDFTTLGQAAAKGGYATICPMPNTFPCTDTVEVLEQVKALAAEHCCVNVKPYGTLSQGLISEEELSDYQGMKVAGAIAFTNDGKGVQSADTIHQMMTELVKVDAMYVSHSETESILNGGVMNKGAVSEKLGLPGIMNAVESTAVATELLLARETTCKYHICHISTKESFELLKLAKSWGVDATAEVSPHHLLLCDEDIPGDDVNYKMNPPLRSRADLERLRQAFIQGELDIIATDHAPHSAADKSDSMIRAAFGIIGLEDAFSLLYTEFVKTSLVTLEYLIQTMSTNPAKRFGIEVPELKIGKLANLVVIDLEAEREIGSEGFASKSSNSPFIGKKVFGETNLTIVNGDIVYMKGTK